MSERKCKLIIVACDDGTILMSEGDDADKVWQSIIQTQTMAHFHGMGYEGSPMTRYVAELK